jgi:choice-of-anchor A domain-containing protein
MHYKRLFLSMSIGVVAVGIFTAGAATDTLPGGAIKVGSADYFTVLAKGDASFTDNNITGPSMVTGNIGIGGQGNFTMSDGDVFGNVVLHTGATFKTSGPAKVHGSVMTNDSQLHNALADAQSLSDAAWAETPTMALSNVNITNVNQSMTITGGPNQKVVLRLTDFTMSAGTFTLQGTATTSFIINVTRNFSLNNAKIVLSGGVPPQNVLFNIRGTGGQVSLNQGTQLPGILLALNRKVDLSGGHVTGKVIADQVVITSGGSVVTPTTNR